MAPVSRPGSDPRGGSAACGTESEPVDARVWERGVPGKLGSRDWQSPQSSRKWPWERSPTRGTRSLAHLRARGGPGALSTGSSRAPSPSLHRPLPRPQGQTGTRIPQAGQTSRRHLLWFTDGSGGEGTPNHTGGQRYPPGQRASQPPPGLPASRPPPQELATQKCSCPHSKTWEGPPIPRTAWGQALGWALMMTRRGRGASRSAGRQLR